MATSIFSDDVTIAGDLTVTGNLSATDKVQEDGADLIPSGIIVMWSGSIATIPSGWVLCDGNNSTPDLTNRFIVGADADDSGTAKSTVTGAALQTSDGQVIAHTHFAFYNGETNATMSASNQAARKYTVSGDPSTDVRGSTNDATVGKTSEYGTGTKNIATFYALAYIMKT